MKAEIAPVRLPDSGVLVQESRHGSDFRIPPHRHDCLSLLIAVDGKGACRMGDSMRPLEADDVLSLPGGTEHQVTDNARRPLTLFVVYLSDAFLRAAPDLIDAREPRLVRLPRQSAAEVRRLLRRALHEQTRNLPGRSLLIAATATELLVLIRRAADHRPRRATPEADSRARAAQVAKLLHERYYDPWSLTEAARTARMSVRNFSQAFRELYGRSFVQYLNRVRIEEARRMLRDGREKVSTICFRAGFEDLSHFYRVFRQITGHPPGEERQRAG